MRKVLRVPPKRRFLQDPHDATSQEVVFFIETAVKTSNPTDSVVPSSYLFVFGMSRGVINPLNRLAVYHLNQLSHSTYR
jgi:hypothetical protein